MTLSSHERNFLRSFFETAPHNDRNDLVTDIVKIARDRTVTFTERKILAQARIGQGLFRAKLLVKWDGKCAVTGCSVREILKASHIKPWRCCTNDERLNSENGLLLSATLDAMFDAYLITFEHGGKLVISNRWPKTEHFHIPRNTGLTRPPSREQQAFLKHHRKQFYRMSQV